MAAPDLWFQHRDWLVCAPPKCGGTALYCAALDIDPAFQSQVFSRALERTRFYTPDEVVASRCKAIMAVRDPVGRFASLWRDKCRDGDANLSLTGLSPDQLMQLIEDQPAADAHWLPQTFYHRAGIRVVPFRFLLVHLGLRMVQVNRTTAHEDDPPLPVERIRKHYAADVDLCSQS